VPAAALPQAIKQVIETKQLLEGQATSRVEHIVEPRRVSSLEEYEQQIGPLEKKARARMVEASQEMHFSWRKKPAAGRAAGLVPELVPRIQARWILNPLFSPGGGSWWV
jgi:hypothetical protein